MKTKKKPTGRPSGYKKEYADLLLTFLCTADLGAGILDFCRHLGISKDTFYEWVAKYDAFSDAFARGRAAEEATWLREAIRRSELPAKTHTPGLFELIAANKFGWSRKSEVEQRTTNTNTNVTVEAPEETAAAIAAKILEGGPDK